MKLSLKKKSLKNLSNKDSLANLELPKNATPEVGGASPLHTIPRTWHCTHNAKSPQ
ncbi:hypothetical protein VIBNISFn27_900025 [Vibrio nigripulchritudo SFn27]|uniref:Uncharacterized protein n=1 Tax=Vibrio nigripulchritudo TaxID=28173 RepID=U4KIZ4_9VIBR|nr:hypothetical protein [Vibrio nigripulchritudo]CCN81363.1 hypothetical protein VIBNIBLFn1_210025 [Vibrio nigripulchritudo BLFn1]CCN91218.1 hypothetical protein VIBNISFn27_900025 [Vibrio nigripulchritudo SFn27]CCN96317.1 hypothetical protein VIBNIENn2_740025 [Vibrio nigripulchritudo ENn2]CCO38533.1 hypothetical protein VIBNISFn135_1010025 [Vibrio nigripulchritudo SFn135]CCO50438.1 hypothetical protein VIBNIWn13_100037 [Vibrio nigripulchritudo Wn13]